MDAEIFTICLIKKFLSEGKNFFTYNSLRHFYYKNKIWRFFGRKYDWHTIERTIRKLARMGVLIRRGTKKVIFELDEERAKKHVLYKLLERVNANIYHLPDGRIIFQYKGREYCLYNREDIFRIVEDDISKLLNSR